MKRFICISLILASLSISSSTFAQGFTPPAEGNAVVYLSRVTKYGYAVSFDFFLNDQYLGLFKGKNYMRVEVPAGENLLWGSSENKQFIPCNFVEGETYIVLVNVIMGVMKARIGLSPIMAEGEDFERAKELILDQAPVVTPEKVMTKNSKKLADKDFVEKMLKRYEEDWKPNNPEATKPMGSEHIVPKNLIGLADAASEEAPTDEEAPAEDVDEVAPVEAVEEAAAEEVEEAIEEAEEVAEETTEDAPVGEEAPAEEAATETSEENN